MGLHGKIMHIISFEVVKILFIPLNWRSNWLMASLCSQCTMCH